MRLVIDTNRYSDLGKATVEVEETLARADEVLMPFVVLAELRVGFRRGSRWVENEKMLERFLAQPGYGVLYADRATINFFTDLSVYLLDRGLPIPTHDKWIAALTLQHGLTLYSRDKHFDYLPQLQRI